MGSRPAAGTREPAAACGRRSSTGPTPPRSASPGARSRQPSRWDWGSPYDMVLLLCRLFSRAATARSEVERPLAERRPAVASAWLDRYDRRRPGGLAGDYEDLLR